MKKITEKEVFDKINKQLRAMDYCDLALKIINLEHELHYLEDGMTKKEKSEYEALIALFENEKQRRIMEQTTVSIKEENSVQVDWIEPEDLI